MENKIINLHNSDAFGVLIETGCGLAVSNALLEVSGASNTVYFAECPYSKIFQDKKYGETKHRAVSKENIDRFISYYELDFRKAESNNGLVHEGIDNLNEDAKKLNFIFASTFQIGEHNNKSTHGWIGVWTKNVGCRYFHISIHESLSRKEYIDKISKIGIDILYHCTITEPDVAITIPSNCCIDIALDKDGNQVDLKDMFMSLWNEEDENFLCIKDGQLIRMEDLFRDQENILLFKGSFNPIHSAHIHTSQLAKEKYAIEPVFMISSSVYQKGWIEPTDLKHRVETLNALGYSVVITKDGYFNKNTAYIRNKFKQPIVYVVGSDTLNRILESSYNILNPRESERFIHFGHQISQIRSAEGKNVTEEDLMDNERMALGHYTRLFMEDFKDASFFVVNRPGSELKEIKNHADNIGEKIARMEDYYTLAEEHPDYHHISSTKIRAMLVNGDYESIKKLIPEKIFEMYINKFMPSN